MIVSSIRTWCVMSTTEYYKKKKKNLINTLYDITTHTCIKEPHITYINFKTTISMEENQGLPLVA